MPLTRSTSDATRVVSSLIPQKRKSPTVPSTDTDAEGQATDADPEALTATDKTEGDTWSDTDQDDVTLPSMNELIDQVILLDNKRQSPWTERGAPDKPLHWANQYVRTQQVIEPFSSKEDALIVEKIQLKKAHLFPELYLQFRNQFALKSDVHRDYCRCTPEGFRGCLQGTAEQIDEAVGMMNAEFSRAFRLCLDHDDYPLRQLALTSSADRDSVERKFFSSLLKSTKAVNFLVRENELTWKALNGDINPFIYFMQAFKQSYRDIWTRIAPLLIKLCKTEDNLQTFRKEMYKNYDKTGDIFSDMNTFVDTLVDKKLFFKKTPWQNGTRCSTNQDSDFSNKSSYGNSKEYDGNSNKKSESDSGKTEDSTSANDGKVAQKDNKPTNKNKRTWLPPKEFKEQQLKIREEKKKK